MGPVIQHQVAAYCLLTQVEGMNYREALGRYSPSNLLGFFKPNKEAPSVPPTTEYVTQYLLPLETYEHSII